VTLEAILALEDGSIFQGTSIGALGITTGEVVFNTAMTGYQEILTDPSYTRQLVTLTYPHIGNTGICADDNESAGMCAAGLIVRDLPREHSNWRASAALGATLAQQGVVAIADIDTRRLTRILRSKGAQNGAIVAGHSPDAQVALAQARGFAGLTGMDLAKVVSTKTPYEWTQPTAWAGASRARLSGSAWHVIAYDFGIKHNILRLLVNHGARVTVVPAQTPARAVLDLEPDGVFLSNGPGDPAPCDYAIAAIRELLKVKLPLFGICLGHQLLALAAGAKTLKMKFGHHGANHPVQDLVSKRVLITSQNHGFAVDELSLPANVRATHRSLFDNSLQGIELTDAPAFSFQGHPEASPGPHDIDGLFGKFSELMRAHRAAAAVQG
jgi:carbamoyl-phosphate synthase small subunit